MEELDFSGCEFDVALRWVLRLFPLEYLYRHRHRHPASTIPPPPQHHQLIYECRKLLQRFLLPPEAQQIDRVMEKFAKQYYKQNPDTGVFSSFETVYIAAFSTIMLNTDAHNPNVKRKMTKSVRLWWRVSF